MLSTAYDFMAGLKTAESCMTCEDKLSASRCSSSDVCTAAATWTVLLIYLPAFSMCLLFARARFSHGKGRLQRPRCSDCASKGAVRLCRFSRSKSRGRVPRSRSSEIEIDRVSSMTMYIFQRYTFDDIDFWDRNRDWFWNKPAEQRLTLTGFYENPKSRL
jgi:hypothetical protein